MKIGYCIPAALRIRSLPVTQPDTDTGRRMIRGQAGLIYGQSLDSKWWYIDAPAGRGWVHGDYLTVAEETPEVAPDPAWPTVPTGRTGIESIFGRPGRAPCHSGRVHLPAVLPLSWQPATKIQVFACHKLLEDVFESVFDSIHGKGHWGLLENFGGCYNSRTVTGSQKVSTHAWGISVDLNTLTNALGAPPRIDRRIVAVFEDHGFVWGGNWSRPDGMHFQYAKGY